MAETRLPPSTSIPPIPLLPTNPPWFWPYFPLCCLYLALWWWPGPYLLFLLGQCTLVWTTGHLPLPPLPLTPAALPLTSPGWRPSLHASHRGHPQVAATADWPPISIRLLPPVLLIPPPLPPSPLGQSWCHMWPRPTKPALLSRLLFAQQEARPAPVVDTSQHPHLAPNTLPSEKRPKLPN